MLESVAYRGPDGAGMWSEGPVGLGHRMLHTTPESLHEELPLVNKTEDLVLTADARIDNRDELIAALGLTGRTREEITDGGLVLPLALHPSGPGEGFLVLLVVPLATRFRIGH